MDFLYVKNANYPSNKPNFKFDGVLGLGNAPMGPGDPKVFVQALYD
jgi:hypothetical protein